jgi:hypothetical protein
MNIKHEIPKGEERQHIEELFCECCPYFVDTTVFHNALRETNDHLHL